MRLIRRLLVVSLWLILAALPAEAQTNSPVAAPQLAGRNDNAVLDGVLELLKEAVITQLDAQVSLENLSVEQGRIRLRGVRIENLRVGLLLKADNARRLASALQERAGTNAQANDWRQMLSILKLGLFETIEVSVTLRELRVRRLDLDADDLQVAGLLVQAAARSPGSDVNGPQKPVTKTGSTLDAVIEVLRYAALNRVSAHLGLEKLAARRLHLELDGASLNGLVVRLALLRPDENAKAVPVKAER